ncbi:MAG: glycosyltransferase family 4 protein [Ferruginibacter sp.]
MPDRTLFLTLRIFSATGGIEKVSRSVGKALYELSKEQPGSSLQVMSMYDKLADLDEKYFPATVFGGFGEDKLRFMSAAIKKGMNSDVVILSHINLLLAGYIIKLFSPKTRLILLAHGVEIWGRLPAMKNIMLKKCDQVVAVSRFTQDKVVVIHGVSPAKCVVLNNCLDPFLPVPQSLDKDAALMQRYGLQPQDIVLITLTRLSSREQYKGYDNVLQSLFEIKKTTPNIKYLVIGKYDTLEKQRIDNIITSLDLQQQVIFAGFIPEEEVGAHYSIADIYIMPSKKEGFGIVFIEAMYYGKPVIAGNKDGSVDALHNGKFGLLVDPDNLDEITAAITKVINDTAAYVPQRQTVMDKFSYPVYKDNLRKILLMSR